MSKNTMSIDEAIGTEEIVTGAPSGTLQTMTNAGVVGQVDREDVRFPKIQIVQGVGPLSERDEFRKGDIILDGDTRIGGNGDMVELTVLQIGKQYEEVVAYDGDDIPRIVDTKEEVLKLGGTTEGHRDGGKWVGPTWRAIADALVCIEAPAGIDEEQLDVAFPFEAPKEKGKFTFARWVIKGVAYKSAAVEIFSAASLYYRDGLRKGTFRIDTSKRTFGPNTVMVPTVRKGKRNTPEFSSWLSEFA
jgi:hypothetical protein